MADVESNIKVSIDTTEALAQLKNLQRQISAFHSSIAKTGAAGTAVSNNLSQNLVNQINASGKFYAEMTRIKTTTESFNDALEKNKLSMGQYFRYAGASTKTFGKLFKEEFNTINKVARENVKTLQTQYIKMGRDASGAVKAMSIRPLALDMNDYATKTAMAAQRQALLNQLLKQGSTNLLNFGKNTQWAGRQLMVGFTVPLMYMGTAAAKSFMQMEEQAIRFKRVYGEMFTTTEETSKALKEIELLAKGFTKYGVAVADTMKMAADAAAMGKMGADLTAQVAEATRLSVLGTVEQGQALETTISLSNAFGITADKLAGKIDFLNAVENQTVTSIEDLTIAIPKAGPVIQQLGGNVEDLAFFLTAMKEGGINASEGANALKSGLASLINPSKKATEFLGGFGVNLKGIVEANKGDVKGTVVSFAQALDTLDPLNRARAIEQLFGKFQFSRLSTLFQNVVAQGTQASKVMTLANATTEELAILSERELNKVAESPMYKFKKSVEDLKVSLAPVGEQFLKAATPIIEFVSKILEAFNGLGDGTKKFVTLLVAGVAGIGPILLMSFGLLANGVANIIKMFTNIKGVFNRAGQSSTILGEQTNFLTQEQLKAASVAASLDQAHTRLQQRFTSEAQAVQLLTAAYRQGIAAQNAFMPGFGTSGKPKKYAKGIVSVPGSGTGDTVPAMLAPGEAVVPAKMASKYSGLINGMIADNIPGYETGLPALGKGFKNATMYLPESMNTIMGGTGKGVLTPDVVRYLQNAGEAAMAPLMAVMAKSMGMKISDPKFKDEWITIGTELGQSATKALNDSGREFIKDEDLEEIVVPALRKTAKELNVAGREISTSLDSAIDEIHTVGQVGTQSGSVKGGKGGRTALDRLSYRNVREDSQKFAAEQKPGMFSRDTRISSSGATKRIFRTFNTQTQSWEVATMAHLTKSITTTVSNLIAKVRPYLGDQTARIIKATAKSIEDGAKSELKVASPSQEARRIGKATGQGFILGAEEGINKAAKTGVMAGTMVADKSSQARSRVALYGNGPVDAESKSIRRQLEKRKRLEEVQSRYAIRGSQVSSMAASVGPKPVAGRVSGLMSKLSPGSAVMGATGVAMAGSMLPGKVGEVMQKLMMPLMGLSMILPLLNSKFGALTVGVGAVVAAYTYMRMQFDKAQDSAFDLSNAMGVGKEAMLDLSKAANKVSAGEQMDRRRQNKFNVLPIQTGKSTFGQSFVQQDIGKKMLSNISKNGGANASLGSTASQLQNAVMSGAMSMDQAKSAAANLGEQLGDYTFGIKLIGSLTELLGPNGENLDKNPYEVRLKMIQDTQSRINFASQASNQAANGNRARKNNILGVSDNIQTGGGIAAGAGAGAGAGALIGSMIVPGIGTAIGAVAGTIVGAIAGGIMGKINRAKRIGEMTGASVAQDKMAIEQGQELLDSFDLQYQRKIELLKAQGKINEAVALENKYYADRDKLLAANKQTKDMIISNFTNSDSAVQNAYMTGTDKAVTKKYKDTVYEDMVPLAQTSIDSSQLTKEQKLGLKLELESGNIDPNQMINMFKVFTEKEDQEVMLQVIGKFGGKFAAETMSVVNGFGDNKKLKKDYLIQVNSKSGKDAQQFQDFFGRLSMYGNNIPADISVDYFLKNPKAQKETQALIGKIDAKKGKMDLNFVVSTLGAKGLAAVNADLAYWNSLDETQQKVYTTAIAYQLSLEGDADQQAAFKAWQKENVGKGPTEYVNFAQQKAEAITIASKDTTLGSIGSNTPAQTKEVQASTLDDLLKRLRDVRKMQIDVTKGWDASMKALKKLYGVGKDGKITKDIQGFGGLEQKLRASGANQGTIDLITGLSPEDYQKYKDKLFTIDKKTGKLRLKEAQILNKVLNGIAVGDFQNSQEKQIKDYQNQSVALTKLMAAGMSVAEAYDAIEDPAFAAAVASGQFNDKAIKGMVKLSPLLTKARKDFEAIKEANTIAANIKLGNFEEAASPGISAAMKYFDIQEKIIEMNYRGRIKEQEDIIHTSDLAIKAAQAIQDANSYQMSKYQYEVDLIDEKAAGITKKYDEQFEALDKVSQINEVIAGQQQRQLGLADALSQGDISAAAKAAQEMRAANAKDALAQQRSGMEDARDAAISRLTGPGGLTKDQLEKNINVLKKANAKIDYDTIEPQKEISRQAQVQLDILNESVKKETSSLSLLGLSKTGWEDIATKAGAAEFAAGKYDTALNGALTTLKTINETWDAVLKKLKDYNLTKVVDPTDVKDKQEDDKKKDDAPPPVVKTGSGKTDSGSTSETSTTSTGPISTPSASTKIVGGNSGIPTSTVTTSGGYSGIPLSKTTKTIIPATTKITGGNSGIPSTKVVTPAKTVSSTSTTKIIPASGGYGGIPYTPAKTVVIKKSNGGMIMPAKFANGGFAVGTDTVPAMLTPGEFIVSKYGVDKFGIDNLKAINSGSYSQDSSVYNYNLSVNVKSDANPNEIARTVMAQIKQIDGQRIRGNRF